MKFKKKGKNCVPSEDPIVEVKKGLISMTDLYKYLGDWYNETGSNIVKIEQM